MEQHHRNTNKSAESNSQNPNSKTNNKRVAVPKIVTLFHFYKTTARICKTRILILKTSVLIYKTCILHYKTTVLFYKTRIRKYKTLILILKTHVLIYKTCILICKTPILLSISRILTHKTNRKAQRIGKSTFAIRFTQRKTQDYKRAFPFPLFPSAKKE